MRCAIAPATRRWHTRGQHPAHHAEPPIRRRRESSGAKPSCSRPLPQHRRTSAFPCPECRVLGSTYPRVLLIPLKQRVCAERSRIDILAGPPKQLTEECPADRWSAVTDACQMRVLWPGIAIVPSIARQSSPETSKCTLPRTRSARPSGAGLAIREVVPLAPSLPHREASALGKAALGGLSVRCWPGASCQQPMRAGRRSRPPPNAVPTTPFGTWKNRPLHG
jgi:hypothetical protein